MKKLTQPADDSSKVEGKCGSKQALAIFRG